MLTDFECQMNFHSWDTSPLAAVYYPFIVFVIIVRVFKVGSVQRSRVPLLAD